MSAHASSPLIPEPGLPRRPAALELTLRIADPEMLEDLLRYSDPEARDRHALNALRLGILALRMASGQLDAETLKRTGDQLFERMDHMLRDRASTLTADVARSLERYLHPETGVMPQRLREMVKKDGELDRVLGRWVNREDSMLSKTLAEQVGKDSSLFRMLSPNEADGLMQQLARLVEERLRIQREGLLQQFSLDDKQSALSRFLGEIEGRQGDFRKTLDERMQTLTREFSLDNPDSAVTRFQRLMEELRERNDKFQGEVRGLLERLESRQQVTALTTLGGLEFEQALGQLLGAEAQRLGDVLETTGESTGLIPRSKIGDFVLSLGAESASAGARIVWEAKRDADYNLRMALDELKAARQNRAAQIGVFVFARQSAPPGLESFGRYGNDVVVVWDPEDSTSALLVRAAYGVARALAVRERHSEEEGHDAASEIERAVVVIERQTAYLDEFRKWAETMKGHSEKIIDRADRMKNDLESEVQRLQEQVAALRAAD